MFIGINNFGLKKSHVGLLKRYKYNQKKAM